MTRYWVIVAAAGCGTRMKSSLPKQYLPLKGKPVLSHTLDALLGFPLFEKIVTVIQSGDIHWQKLGYDQNSKILVTQGGQERYHSVLNGLNALNDVANPNDFVLVHDAARPYLKKSDIEKLLKEVGDHPVGGLLGIPIRDTIKRVDAANNVLATTDRNQLWCAYTPQMFRFGLLVDALQAAISNHLPVTDEASAIELMGLKPLMVEGCRDNIKITYPEDLS